MKLTVEKILNLLPAVNALCRASMPYRLARQTSKIAAWLRSECEAAAGREDELTRLHGGEYDKTTHRNKFNDTESAEAFRRDMEDMLKTELDFPFEKLDLSAVAAGLELSPRQLESVDLIAVFESGDAV